MTQIIKLSDNAAFRIKEIMANAMQKRILLEYVYQLNLGVVLGCHM